MKIHGKELWFENPRAPGGSTLFDAQAGAGHAVPRRWIWLGALALVAAVALAYSNAFSVPFLFDDVGSITANMSLRDWRAALFPPSGETVGGRPLLNVSLALNYAISGNSVWSYHFFNVLIHIVAALALFGLARRALAGGRAGWSGREAFFCALAAAGIWALHPLQTEAVTYVVQRAESLASMWYLLVLYCFARSAPAMETGGRKTKTHFWLAASVLCCALGMATKEVMVSAPALVLLYDRAFVSGSFGAAWRARRKFYLALGATWLVLAACVLMSGFRGGTAGFSGQVTWWMYAATQARAIPMYVKLVFWPAPLVFDYGVRFVFSPAQVLPQIIIMALLAAAALFAMFRWPRAGIFGALFFAVLAPSSSFLPIITQAMAEHRMYLASAAIVTPVVVLCWRLARGRRALLAAAAVAACAVAVVFGALAWRRNATYQSELCLWLDTAAKAPGSERAQCYAGRALILAGRCDEGVARCLEAARLNPRYDEAYYFAAMGLSALGRNEEAIACYQQALLYLSRDDRLHTDGTYLYMGMALRALGRDAEARAAFEKAVVLNPGNTDCLNNLGNYALLAGDYAGAEKYYRQALAAEPGFAEAHGGLANALAAQGRDAEARKHYEEAIRLNPQMAQAHYNYARLLQRLGDTAAARAQAREAARLSPGSVEAAELLKTLQ